MKLKKIFIIILALSATAILASCAGKHIIASEVLQIPEHAKIYTAYNIWYENPDRVDSTNMLKGQIIPFGTEVEILNFTDKEMRFKTVKDSKEFRIIYDAPKHMIAAEDYIRRLFTTQMQEELAEGITPIVFEKLKRGVVEPGMTREEVILAFGPPIAFRTPSEKENTWLYWTDVLVGKRIFFSKGKIIEIIEL